MNETGMNKVTFLDFLINTIKLMFTATPQVELPPQHVGREDVLRLTGRHFPKLLELDQNGRRPTKRCRVCYARAKKGENHKSIKTRYICDTCPSKPGLHPDECFTHFHTLLEYDQIDFA